MSELDVSSMKVADLRRELKARGLASTGNKSELVDRLQMAVMASQSEEDVEKLLEDKTTNDVSVDTSLQTEDNVDNEKTFEQTKKPVAINRDVELPTMSSEKSEEASSTAVETSTTTTTTTSAPSASSSKPAQLSDHDRALARAARFGVQSEKLKKLNRAERFGLKDDKTINLSAPKADMETLRRRADRFGQTTSNAMKAQEQEERAKKRKERFGATSGSSNDEQLKKRRERFGLVTA